MDVYNVAQLKSVIIYKCVDLIFLQRLYWVVCSPHSHHLITVSGLL